MLHQHVTQNTVMIVHGDMTCTGGITTTDTELRQQTGATPQNQLTVSHKKYRCDIEPSAECPESASNCTHET